MSTVGLVGGHTRTHHTQNYEAAQNKTLLTSKATTVTLKGEEEQEGGKR